MIFAAAAVLMYQPINVHADGTSDTEATITFTDNNGGDSGSSGENSGGEQKPGESGTDNSGTIPPQPDHNVDVPSIPNGDVNRPGGDNGNFEIQTNKVIETLPQMNEVSSSIVTIWGISMIGIGSAIYMCANEGSRKRSEK